MSIKSLRRIWDNAFFRHFVSIGAEFYAIWYIWRKMFISFYNIAFVSQVTVAQWQSHRELLRMVVRLRPVFFSLPSHGVPSVKLRILENFTLYLRNSWSLNLRAIENCICGLCSIGRKMRSILRTVRSKSFFEVEIINDHLKLFSRNLWKCRWRKGLSIDTTHAPPPLPLDSTFKGTVSREFCFRFFSWVIFPQAPENSIFERVWNGGPYCDTHGLGGNWFMKKTWSRKSCGTVPWCPCF